MPLYEYQCQDCGLRFERRQSFSAPPVTVCPECEGPVTRLIQPVGIIFKGSGFYVTDNRAKSSTRIPVKTEKEKEEKEKKTAAPSEASTESTSSAKAESSNKDKKE